MMVSSAMRALFRTSRYTGISAVSAWYTDHIAATPSAAPNIKSTVAGAKPYAEAA